MPYLYTVFGATYAGGEVLPTDNGVQPIGSGAVPSRIIQLPGGNSFDSLGSGISRPRSRLITVVGKWLAANVAALDTKIDALNALNGTCSYLWRTNDGGTTKRWRFATCLDVRIPVTPDFARSIPVEIDFELAAGVWSGAAHNEITTLDTTTHNVITTNAGNAWVRDAIITITAAGTPITAVVVKSGDRWYWEYTGSIAVGKVLYVDGGIKRVWNENIGDDFAHLMLNSVWHHEDDWQALVPGMNTIVVIRTGGNASSTFKIDYSDGWV